MVREREASARTRSRAASRGAERCGDGDKDDTGEAIFSHHRDAAQSNGVPAPTERSTVVSITDHLAPLVSFQAGRCLADYRRGGNCEAVDGDLAAQATERDGVLAVHAAQSWHELLDAVGRVVAGRYEAASWRLAVARDGALFTVSPDELETPIADMSGPMKQALDGGRSVRIQRGANFVVARSLPFDGNVWGVLEVAARKAHGLDDEFIRHLAVAVRNVSALTELRARTVRDETTGLSAAHHMRDVLERELHRSRRFGHSVAVMFIDLDHFKNVNDKFGHLVGTAVLVNVAERLSKNIRKVDTAFRYGGDEFVLLLVETTLDQARIAADRVRRALAEPVFRAPTGVQVPLTVSIGLSAFPEDGETVDDLLGAADKALYKAKASGRNGIVGTDDLAGLGSGSADLSPASAPQSGLSNV